MSDLGQLTQILLERLEKKGMDPTLIPGFIRNLGNAILFNPEATLLQASNRLHLLGWDDFELDYRTLELATACFEEEGLKEIEEYRPIDSGSVSDRGMSVMNG